MQEQIKLKMRGEEVNLKVEPQTGDHIRVVSGISNNVEIETWRLEIFEQFYQSMIKKALQGGKARAGFCNN